MTDVEARLARLELSARRWRLAAVGLGLVVAVVRKVAVKARNRSARSTVAG